MSLSENNAPTTPPEPWRQLLLDAAGLIETHGHAQHCMEDGEGHLCIMGAVNVALGGSVYSNEYQTPVAVEARDRLCKLTDQIESWGSVCDFNNHHTKDEVIATLRACARGD